MEPPNKGHFGANINSAVVSFVYRAVVLSSEVQNVLGKQNFGTLTCVLQCVERSIILCPYMYLGGSTMHDVLLYIFSCKYFCTEHALNCCLCTLP